MKKNNFGFLIFKAWAIFLSLSVLSHCQKEEEKQLLIWQSYNNEENQVFSEIVGDFEKSSGIKIKIERVPFDGFLSKLITSAIANKTPDITRIDIGHLARLAAGKIALKLDDFGIEPTMTELLQIVKTSNTVWVKGKDAKLQAGLYGLTDQLTGVALFYNKDLFRAAGLDPERPPQTWDEFILHAKKLTQKEKGQFGFAMNASVWWILPFLYSFGADVLSADNQHCRINDSKAQQAVSFLRKLYLADKVEAGAWKAGAINPDQGFVNQKFAMILSGPWNIKTFQKVNYGVALIPANDRLLKEGGARSATNIGGTSMIVLQNSRFKKESVAFLKYLASKEVQLKWTQKLGQISIRKDVNLMNSRTTGDPHLHQIMQVFKQQLTFARSRPQVPNYDQIENIVNPILYSIMEGSLEVTAGLEKACQFIDERVLSELKK